MPAPHVGLAVTGPPPAPPSASAPLPAWPVPIIFSDLLSYVLSFANGILSSTITVVDDAADAAEQVVRPILSFGFAAWDYILKAARWVQSMAARVVGAWGEHWGLWEKPWLTATHAVVDRLNGAWFHLVETVVGCLYTPLEINLQAQVLAASGLWSASVASVLALQAGRTVAVLGAKAADEQIFAVETRVRDAFGVVGQSVTAAVEWINHGFHALGVVEERVLFWSYWYTAGHLWAVMVNSTLGADFEPGGDAEPASASVDAVAAAVARFASGSTTSSPAVAAAVARFAAPAA